MMTSNLELENADDDDDCRLPPGPGERWDPLGADNDDEEEQFAADHRSSLAGFEVDECGERLFSPTDPNRIRNLEEEQEVLTTSLMALTSHFAQVQFRLRQIVDAPITQRDLLLKNLEEFAFRGIPEITGSANLSESDEVITSLERARNRQFELIDRLKRQLTELEKFAYESGAPVLPQSILVEKQKIIIDELKSKLNLKVNDVDLPQLSSEDIKFQVDTAIGEFVGPLKMKEQLVAQLKTQIADLERFIAFLQNCEAPVVDCGPDEPNATPRNNEKEAYNSYAAKKKQQSESSGGSNVPQKSIPDAGGAATFNHKAHGLMDKASTLLQMFAVAQFGCGSTAAGRFQKNSLKKSSRANHWGDTRAQLEVAIQEVASLAMTLKRDRERQQRHDDSAERRDFEASVAYTSDSDDDEDDGRYISARNKTFMPTIPLANFSLTNVELTTVVRRNLATMLQKLIQHGLRTYADMPGGGGSLVPFIGCFRGISPDDGKDRPDSEANETSGADLYEGQMHAWELILQYYNIKNGEQYNETPARKLSQSFNLDIVGGSAISNKQSLLSAIGAIIAMHSPYKRSYNSHFKAFVCAALNSQKLVVWLNLLFQCTELTQTYYTSWSYVARTGFREALRSLDVLTKYEFELPVDLAVRQFQNIKDVFM